MTSDNGIKDSLVSFQTSQGLDLRGSLVRLTRLSAVFEIYAPNSPLRISEALTDFRIFSSERLLYCGRAVVTNLINGATVLICETSLEDDWADAGLPGFSTAIDSLRGEFNNFTREWQNLYRVLPEYKVVIADLHTFLTDLRLWLNQLELGVRSSPSGDRFEMERAIVDEISEPVVRSIDVFIDRFETIASKVEPEMRPVHRSYLRRQLHPLLLCSPFAYRTFHKPLGYAGDYEVVNMMLRQPHEGSTLFAKTVNVWLLGQKPVQGHRNRVDQLVQTLLEVTAQSVRAQRRTARILSLGCGPAVEVQRFIKEQPLSEQARFTLLDFNDETLQHLQATLDGVKRASGRATSIELVRKSVHQLLKDSSKAAVRPVENCYDLIYCAGLFDYLPDPVCKRLMNLCYDMLAPGGLLLATNVSDSLNTARPFRHSMEYILDWHLIYRNGPRVAALVPAVAASNGTAVSMDDTGSNLFVSVRKPNHV
jgi:extracellular factor (EF) 3-hydroxypalmitic acid methyl ester biosynthesis protein